MSDAVLLAQVLGEDPDTEITAAGWYGTDSNDDGKIRVDDLHALLQLLT